MHISSFGLCNKPVKCPTIPIFQIKEQTPRPVQFLAFIPAPRSFPPPSPSLFLSPRRVITCWVQRRGAMILVFCLFCSCNLEVTMLPGPEGQDWHCLHRTEKSVQINWGIFGSHSEDTGRWGSSQPCVWGPDLKAHFFQGTLSGGVRLGAEGQAYVLACLVAFLLMLVLFEF